MPDKEPQPRKIKSEQGEELTHDLEERRSPDVWRAPASSTSLQTAHAIARVLANVSVGSGLFGLSVDLSPSKRREARRSLEEQKALVVQELIDNDIDPLVFDSLLTSEQNRRLKLRFGTLFLLMTLLVTACSYSIVILNAIYAWNISEVAVTALVIETPIQFVGLLYIIARNLFPVSEESSTSLAKRGVTILGSTGVASEGTDEAVG